MKKKISVQKILTKLISEIESNIPKETLNYVGYIPNETLEKWISKLKLCLSVISRTSTSKSADKYTPNYAHIKGKCSASCLFYENSACTLIGEISPGDPCPPYLADKSKGAFT